ncbi:uncharacterized protein HMPREF1541_03271 [Cyphellophora europaea CBS 101466]|uniref:Enoyl reductase (ER) domain-containing protein n=1 Tax=Cyphellophora europaea (strain CBS 101466) TaxID=1220924 RepID=W2RXU7_CYPE1|nr:uncharacterized protein HMPREF1541_03271 [Cyphellophora europaea CBS 101466]ETN41336.1 hypothetical protein HMPREF1541_03271 [Cyphellophora europaea CBS 101466]
MESSETRSWTTNLDGIPALRLTTTPTPSPSTLSPTQILVKILAVSLNYKDAEIISGLFKHHKSSVAPPNLIPCADSVGIVVATGRPSTQGPDATTTTSQPWKPGDRVLSLSYPKYLTGPALPTYLAAGVGSATHGCLTTHRVFSADAVLPCPPHLSASEAACLPIAGTTAWMGLTWSLPLGIPAAPSQITSPRAGQTLLVQGTGGVSIFGLLLGKAMGMRVLVTSSSDDKLARARALGADAGINYAATPAWDEEVLRLTEGEGADVIFENGGAGSTDKSFRCVRFGGQIAAIGYVGGKVDRLAGKADDHEDRLNINVLALARNVTLKGLLNGPRDRMEDMLAFVAEQKIRPVVDRVFAFEDAREALTYLWEGKHFGKVVIKVADEQMENLDSKGGIAGH